MEELLKGGRMAKIYYELIKKGLKTIDDVPANLKDDVLALLNQENGESNA